MALRTSERWVHPPLLGREAPSAQWAAWRYRLGVAVLLVVLVLAFVLLYRQLTGANEQDPGIGGTPTSPSAPVTGPLPGEG